MSNIDINLVKDLTRILTISKSFVEKDYYDVERVDDDLCFLTRKSPDGWVSVVVLRRQITGNKPGKYPEIKNSNMSLDRMIKSSYPRINSSKEGLIKLLSLGVSPHFDIRGQEFRIPYQDVEYNGFTSVGRFFYNYEKSGNCGAIFFRDFTGIRYQNLVARVVDYIMVRCNARLFFATDMYGGTIHQMFVNDEVIENYFDNITISTPVRNANSGNEICSISAATTSDLEEYEDEVYDEDEEW